MPIVELNAVTGVRQYFGDETIEFQEFFLWHVMFLVNGEIDVERVDHGRGPTGLCVVRRQ